MTPHQFIGCAVRLFAIWLVLTALQAIGTGIATEARPTGEPTVVPYFFASLFIIVAILLWMFPMVIAHRIVPRSKYNERLAIPSEGALIVATVVLGLWLLVARAVPAISFYASVAAYWTRNGQTISSLGASYHASFVTGVVQLVAALVLILKAPSIAAFISSKHREEE
jgi:hypothetical protein